MTAISLQAVCTSFSSAVSSVSGPPRRRWSSMMNFANVMLRCGIVISLVSVVFLLLCCCLFLCVTVFRLPGKDAAGADVGLLYGLEHVGVEHAATGEQPVGLTQAGTVQRIADRSGIGEARLVHPQVDILLHGLTSAGRKAVMQGGHHGF